MQAKALRVGHQVPALSQRSARVLSLAGEDSSFASFLCGRYLDRKLRISNLCDDAIKKMSLWISMRVRLSTVVKTDSTGFVPRRI
jgi:hypothetical protein